MFTSLHQAHSSHCLFADLQRNLCKHHLRLPYRHCLGSLWQQHTRRGCRALFQLLLLVLRQCLQRQHCQCLWHSAMSACNRLPTLPVCRLRCHVHMWVRQLPLQVPPGQLWQGSARRGEQPAMQHCFVTCCDAGGRCCCMPAWCMCC